MFKFQQKLKHLKEKIKHWNSEVFGNIFQEKEKLDSQMKELQQEIMASGPSEALREKEVGLLQEITLKDRQEELLWKQKSRNRRLKEGDRNTKFFHQVTIQHQYQNHIRRLKKEDGSVVESQSEIEETPNEYFQDLLEEPDVHQGTAREEVLRHILAVINEVQNSLLLQPIEMPELEEAMCRMADDKAPGMDGFTTNFFHLYWDWIKEEVMEIVEALRRARGVLKAFNATFLTLIPKETSAADPSKFRSIALCNVIY